ncbi:YcbK family protein [Nitratireductor mangrovi]|uniref:Murein endopeptidase K n=1 Tax=Nitratireductor mangrovi TaxID=2599600 RepID=A0A5B8L5I1_9HYPH|nr:YcbK family protein [Nitratireductor mangrovi]
MLDVTAPSFTGTSPNGSSVVLETIDESEVDAAAAPTPDVIGDEDPLLPAEVAYLPADKPGTPILLADSDETAEAPVAAGGTDDEETTTTGDTETAAETAPPPVAAIAPAPEKPGFFASFFANRQPVGSDDSGRGDRRPARTQATGRGQPDGGRVTTVALATPQPRPEVPEVAEASGEGDAGAAVESAATNDRAAETEPTAFLENGPGPAPAPAPQKRGFFANLFSNDGPSEPAERRPVIKREPKPQPVLRLASTGPSRPVVDRSAVGGDALPGVRQDALFEITRKSGLDDDDDIDVHEEHVQVASAAGLARLAPNGLIKQTDHVDIGCLKPSLVRVLKQVERRFGKKVIVTSGYRSPERNRRARGARNSLHMYCAAADVQVPGVSKWDLAAYVRTMPGRGGVGTYCHTKSVHIDVGPERDWNWRCRRRR